MTNVRGLRVQARPNHEDCRGDFRQVPRIWPERRIHAGRRSLDPRVLRRLVLGSAVYISTGAVMPGGLHRHAGGLFGGRLGVAQGASARPAARSTQLGSSRRASSPDFSTSASASTWCSAGDCPPTPRIPSSARSWSARHGSIATAETGGRSAPGRRASRMSSGPGGRRRSRADLHGRAGWLEQRSTGHASAAPSPTATGSWERRRPACPPGRA